MPKDYEVTLHYSGSYTTTISAPDEEEAIDVAHDELANLAGDLEVEVTDSESCQVDGGYDG
jgi:hypothetical protein